MRLSTLGVASPLPILRANPKDVSYEPSSDKGAAGVGASFSAFSRRTSKLDEANSDSLAARSESVGTWRGRATRVVVWGARGIFSTLLYM